MQLHGHFLTAVKTADVGSFADTGHKTALYGSSTDTQNLPFSRRAENDPYNCKGKQFYETLHVTALYGSSMGTHYLPFSRWTENDPFNCLGMQF